MLDLGLTCPNRDGAKGFGGCIYCDIAGSGTGAARSADLAAQWTRQMARLRRAEPEGPAAIAYLQSYSNTYPDLEPLAHALEFLAARRGEAPILAIGTRPDCFTPEAAALLARWRPHFDAVWLELGLETADDQVQARIGRHDTLANFHRAAALAHEHDLEVVCHTIAGLPGERPGGLLRQVQAATEAGVEGIKFHQLLVLRRTKLEAMWRRGEVELLACEDYVRMVADALELLPSHVVVHRLAAQAPAEEYLAPLGWPSKAAVHGLIERELLDRGSRQGARAPLATAAR